MIAAFKVAPEAFAELRDLPAPESILSNWLDYVDSPSEHVLDDNHQYEASLRFWCEKYRLAKTGGQQSSPNWPIDWARAMNLAWSCGMRTFPQPGENVSYELFKPVIESYPRLSDLDPVGLKQTDCGQQTIEVPQHMRYPSAIAPFNPSRESIESFRDRTADHMKGVHRLTASRGWIKAELINDDHLEWTARRRFMDEPPKSIAERAGRTPDGIRSAIKALARKLPLPPLI